MVLLLAGLVNSVEVGAVVVGIDDGILVELLVGLDFLFLHAR